MEDMHDSSEEQSAEDWLPEKPSEPLQSDCCGTGCTPCVFDIYEQEVAIWKKECERVKRERLTGASDNTQLRVMSPDCYEKLSITSIKSESADSMCYRFQLPLHSSLHMRVGQHLVMRWRNGEKSVTRQYTPISPLSEQEYFDVVIKIYDKGEMSEFVRTWKVGDLVEWRGPFGTFGYKSNSFTRVLMLAAGTGVAPIMQVIRHILENDMEETLVHLMYCCRKFSDIMLKSQLDEWTDYWNFSVQYVLSQDTESGCRGKRYNDVMQYGRLTEAALAKEIGDDLSKTLVLICGTKSFDKDMINYVKKIGVPESHIFKF